jgi:hypothetical protein
MANIFGPQGFDLASLLGGPRRLLPVVHILARAAARDWVCQSSQTATIEKNGPTDIASIPPPSCDAT